MDRLSILLTLMTGSVITGSLVIAVLSFEVSSPWGIVISALIGFALAWPAAYLVSRWIKREDPGWDEKRGQRAPRS